MNELSLKKILIVDDEPEILLIIKETLNKEGYRDVFTAKNCREAMEIINNHSIALCVLDINLPDGNGRSLLSDIRKVSDAAVIFLTASGDTDDRILGLGLGADDYMAKPFSPKELFLRITSVLKRTYLSSDSRNKTVFRLNGKTIDLASAEVVCGDKRTPLTAKEYILLKTLFENRNKIVTYDALTNAAWGDYYYGYENTLTVHIRRIRQKIEENPSTPKHLLTVKGIGYKLVSDDE